MSAKLNVKPSSVHLGIVPTHLRFVGGLVPGEDGKFPRDAKGEIRIVSGMREFLALSMVTPKCVQLPYFAAADSADVDEIVNGLKNLGLEVHFIIMLNGVNPMDPAHEDGAVKQLVTSVKAAIRHNLSDVSSTSIEEWMGAGAAALDAASFEKAVAQDVKVHLRAYKEAGVEGSSVKSWHIEFLRPGEFKTYTNIEKAWTFVSSANRALGKKFFKQIVDAAHCGDSGLGIAENEKLIEKIAAADELGIFHASAKTTRGCLSTDDGWIAALLTACARTGKLGHIFVEIFDHEDPALELLRQLDPKHGVNTLDGRSYAEVTADGLTDIAHRLNNLVVRGILTA